MTIDFAVMIGFSMCMLMASLHVLWRLRDQRGHRDGTPRLLRRSPQGSDVQYRVDAKTSQGQKSSFPRHI